MKTIPGEFQHALLVTDIDKECVGIVLRIRWYKNLKNKVVSKAMREKAEEALTE